MSRAYLSIGSNLGNRLGFVQLAVRRLREAEQVSEVSCSALYSTAPWGGVEQDDFLNAALRVETTLDPYALLRLCRSIEQEAGRQRVQHWGARTLDIDILLYDDVRQDDPVLILPHPYMRERLFVLLPLRDVADEKLLPQLKKWLADCRDTGELHSVFPTGQW